MATSSTLLVRSLIHPLDIRTIVLLKLLQLASTLLLSALFLETVGLSLLLLVWSGVVTTSTVSKLYLLILQLFLNKLLCIITKFREGDLLLLNNERWQLPLPALVIPFCLFFDLIDF